MDAHSCTRCHEFGYLFDVEDYCKCLRGQWLAYREEGGTRTWPAWVEWRASGSSAAAAS